MTTPGHLRSSGSDARHDPVLVAEVMAHLEPAASGVYVDGTVGLGGHAAALLTAGAGRVIGIDRDESALGVARDRLREYGDRVQLIHGDYRQLAEILERVGIERVNGVLVDLGVSSMQLDDATRGFSFRHAGPLDMRMDRSRGEPLSVKLAAVSETELADVIYQLGEERKSRRIARAILTARDRGGLTTSTDLAAAARRGGGGGAWQRLDPATRTFQALRIWVNDELTGLDAFIESAVGVLAAGGRLAVIAFHSLEDRVAKHTMRRLVADGAAREVTKRPVMPADEEVARNPRARSARLRVVEKAA